MKNAIVATSFLTLSSLSAAHLAHAEESGKFSLQTGMNYSSGEYGGTQSTNIVYVPVTGKYQTKDWSVKLTVPYLRISGPSNVINGIGGVGAPTTVTTRSGLGDVIAGATHTVYNGGSSGYLATVTGKIKFGTADNTKGLGTGQNDYSLQTDLYHLSGKLTTFGGIGYKDYGSPATYTLNDVFFGSLGCSYKVDQKTNGGLMFLYKEKTIATGSPHEEAILFVRHKIEKNWKLQGYALKGFTKSSADFGLGASINYLL